MRTIIGAAVLALAAGAVGSGAHAQLMPAYTGLSEFTIPCPLCDSTVNFAVYHNTGANWNSATFFGGLTAIPLADSGAVSKFGAAVDSDAKYVYLYQVVNTNQNVGVTDNPLRDLNIALDSNLLTGAGYFNGVFADSSGDPVDFTNPFMFPYVAGTGNQTPGDLTPSAVAPPLPLGLVGSDAAVDPDLVITGLAISNSATGLAPDSIIYGLGATGIQPGGTSSVMYFTSNYGPKYNWVETESFGGIGSVNDVPVPVAEPASMALLGAGLLGIGATRRRRIAG